MFQRKWRLVMYESRLFSCLIVIILIPTLRELKSKLNIV